MKSKIEFTNPRMQALAFEAIEAGGKLELVSRSSGSGETVHAWVKTDRDRLKFRDGVMGTATVIEPTQLDEVLKKWRIHACSMYSEAARGMVEVPLKDALKTKTGKMVFYVRATTP